MGVCEDRPVGRRLAGIQPGYLPWLGFFDQMRKADVFVVADEMAFTRTGWAHRNRVRAASGPVWLRLPVRPERGQAICDVPLAPDARWRRTHERTLRQCYARTPFPDELDDLVALLDRDADGLTEVTIPIIRWLAARLEIDTPLVVSSEEGLEAGFRSRCPDPTGPTDRIIAFMQQLGADTLLEGATGREYLDVQRCADHGIAVEFHDYDHPVYPQLWSPFVSHLSVVDLLLTAGPDGAAAVVGGVGG